MNNKKSYSLEKGEEVEDGRAEGLQAMRDTGQDAISLMPNVDGTSSGSLLDSFVPTFLKK